VLEQEREEGNNSKNYINTSSFISLMTSKKHFTAEQAHHGRTSKHFQKKCLLEAKEIGEQLGIKWNKFDVEQFRMGMDVELEHGTIDKNTNVTNDNPLTTGKIALAHLNEFSDYYDRLEKMEVEAEKFWENQQNAIE